MQAEELNRIIEGLRIWQRGDERAPHKPLLILFALNDDMIFRVAEDAHGTGGMEEWLMRYNGKQIRKPQRPDYYPEDDFLYWHVREVFRGPARYYN